MPSVLSTLSAGAQLLAGYSNLLPGPEKDVSGASVDSGVNKTRSANLVQAGSTLSASVSSADGDTVELSAEALQMLGQTDHHASTAQPSQSAHPYSAAAAYQAIDFFG